MTRSGKDRESNSHTSRNVDVEKQKPGDSGGGVVDLEVMMLMRCRATILRSPDGKREDADDEAGEGDKSEAQKNPASLIIAGVFFRCRGEV